MLYRNFTQFYSTKTERDKNLRKEYDTQMEYRKHLQAFIDRWRYNANRAAQAQSKIKILEKVIYPLLLIHNFYSELSRRPSRRNWSRQKKRIRKLSSYRRRRRSRRRCFS